jgi:hypothetical protein
VWLVGDRATASDGSCDRGDHEPFWECGTDPAFSLIGRGTHTTRSGERLRPPANARSRERLVLLIVARDLPLHSRPTVSRNKQTGRGSP